MRLPAAVVALPLLAGCSAGILYAEATSLDLPLCAAGGAALALIAGACFFSDGFAEGATAAVALGCALSGLSLGLVAARTAYRPHLLILSTHSTRALATRLSNSKACCARTVRLVQEACP